MSPHLHLIAADRRGILASVAAGLAGFAVNWFPIGFLGDTHLTFGGVFSLLAALTLGPVFGALTALLVELPALVHPHGAGAVLIHVCETAAVGFLVRRRVLPLYALAIYWFAIGTPLVIALQHTRLGIPSGALWAIGSKNVLSGLLNVTLADLITGLPRLRGWMGALPRPAQPLRWHLTRGFMLHTAGAFLALSIALNWVQSGRLEREAGGHMQEAVARVTTELDNNIDRNHAGLLALAAALDPERLGEPQTQLWLEKFHKLYPAFRTITLIDMKGMLWAADPIRTPDGQPLLNLNQNLADREYFKKTIATRAPFISDVFLGRAMGVDPIVMLTVPLFDHKGAMAGIIGGSLRCSNFQNLVESLSSLKERELLILDQRKRVIFASSGAPFEPLEKLAGSPMLAAAARTSQKFFREPRAARIRVGETAARNVWRASPAPRRDGRLSSRSLSMWCWRSRRTTIWSRRGGC